MADVTLYSFENAEGEEDGTFTTFNADAAKERGQRYNLRVIAQTYVYDDSEVAWDFTEPEDEEAVADES